LFIALAAICKAIADTVRDHFSGSIFSRLNPRFWNPEVSWRYAKVPPLTKYKIDSWHLANSGMIVFFCAAIITYKPHLNWAIELVLAGAWFNIIFNLFYNKILIK
jgi:hypothetical protein